MTRAARHDQKSSSATSRRAANPSAPASPTVPRRSRGRSRAGRPRCRASMPLQPGRQALHGVLDGLRHRQGVGLGELLDHQEQRWASPSTASPMSGWWSSMTWVTSPSRIGVSVPSTETWPRSVGRGDRQDVLDGEALVRALDEAAGARRRGLDEGQRRDPQRVAGGLDDLGQRDALPRSVAGSTCTWSCRSRSRRSATLATPGCP